MEVTYKNSKKDLFNVFWHRLLRSKFIYIMAAIFSTISVIQRFSKLVTCTNPFISIVGNFIYQFVLLLVFFLVLMLLYSLIIFPSKKVGESLKQTTMKILEDGVRTETSINTNHRTWDGIVDIRQTKEFILIYITAASSYAIPKRAFASPQAAEEFYQNASDLWLAAKGRR